MCGTFRRCLHGHGTACVRSAARPGGIRRVRIELPWKNTGHQWLSGFPEVLHSDWYTLQSNRIHRERNGKTNESEREGEQEYEKANRKSESEPRYHVLVVLWMY